MNPEPTEKQEGHDHSHGPGAYRGADRRALLIAALLTAGFMVAEAAGGIITGSLALLADAGHMLSDSFSLVLALFAVSLAARLQPSRDTRGPGERTSVGSRFDLGHIRGDQKAWRTS